MTKMTKELLNLVAMKKTLNEMSTELKLDNVKIHKKLMSLKNRTGMEFDRQFFTDGQMIYNLKKDLSKLSNNIELELANFENSVTALLISDLHLGSELERLDLIDKFYDYCSLSNINVIINLGDYLDGYAGRKPKKVEGAEKQIKHLIKKYPFDKNIINFICYGNHDYDLLTEDGINVASRISAARPDLISTGYGLGIINIKNDQLILRHGIRDICCNEVRGKLVLFGHKHHYACDV